MKKTILVAISALILAFTSVARSEMTLSGYTEFFAGSADQTTYQGAANHGIDQSGMSNGNYSRITANYSSTMDSGIEVSGTYVVSGRDCKGGNTGNCNVVDYNFATFSGGFGSISIGERFDAGAAMLDRMTATNPMGEPDGGQLGAFYSGDGVNSFGNANEVNYADASMQLLYTSNVYSGFSVAVGYTPNMGENGANNDDAQADSNSNYSDVTSIYGKYSMDMDGVGLTLVYGQQNGNAGRIGTVDYNDLEETAYSAQVTYSGFAVSIRKNEADNSGTAKNGNAGNNEGTSTCAAYTMGNIKVGACNVETSLTDTNNLTNSSETRTYGAQYELGGGVSASVTLFDVEQIANGVTRTDVDGIATKLSVGF